MAKRNHFTLELLPERNEIRGKKSFKVKIQNILLSIMKED